MRLQLVCASLSYYKYIVIVILEIQIQMRMQIQMQIQIQIQIQIQLQISISGFDLHSCLTQILTIFPHLQVSHPVDVKDHMVFDVGIVDT